MGNLFRCTGAVEKPSLIMLTQSSVPVSSSTNITTLFQNNSVKNLKMNIPLTQSRPVNNTSWKAYVYGGASADMDAFNRDLLLSQLIDYGDNNIDIDLTDSEGNLYPYIQVEVSAGTTITIKDILLS